VRSFTVAFTPGQQSTDPALFRRIACLTLGELPSHPVTCRTPCLISRNSPSASAPDVPPAHPHRPSLSSAPTPDAPAEVPSPVRAAAERPPASAPVRIAVDSRWRNLLCAGLLVLITGMCVLPAGASFNPGKPYQYLLALTLYLPALILGFARFERWRELARRPLVPWLMALFVWSTLSLAWTNAARPLDEILRTLSVLVFLFAWLHGVGDDPRRQRWLLAGGAGVLAATAVAAMIRFAVQPPPDGRVIGFGVMANANLIAAAMGAGFLWLWPWRFQTPARRVLKWLAMAVMATCLVLADSRSAWAALFAAVFALLALRDREIAWRRLLLLGIAALGVVAAAYPELSERGWSFRPQIMQHAWALFEQHPWLGMGQGARFTIPVEGGMGMDQVHTHNLFTQIAVELGLPGLLLWSGIWLALGWRAWQHRGDTVGRMVLGLWVFASVMVQFDLPHLIDSPRPGWLIIWLPLALSLSLPAASTDRRAR